MGIPTVLVSEENEAFKISKDYKCSSDSGNQVSKDLSKEAQKENDETKSSDFCCSIDNECQDTNRDFQESVTIDLLESSADEPKKIYKSDIRVTIEEIKSPKYQSQWKGNSETKCIYSSLQTKQLGNLRETNFSSICNCNFPHLNGWVMTGIVVFIISCFCLWFFNSGVYLIFASRAKQSGA